MAFTWFNKFFRKSTPVKLQPALVPVQPPRKTPEEIARIRAHNRELIKQAAIKWQAHRFSEC